MCKRRCCGAVGRLRNVAAPPLSVTRPGARSPEGSKAASKALATLQFFHMRPFLSRRRITAVSDTSDDLPGPRPWSDGASTGQIRRSLAMATLPDPDLDLELLGEDNPISHLCNAICDGATASSAAVTRVPFGGQPAVRLGA